MHRHFLIFCITLLFSSVAIAEENPELQSELQKAPEKAAEQTPETTPAPVAEAPQNWHLNLELGPSWQSRNEFRLPSGSGTLVKLDEIKSGPFLASRLYLGYRWGDSQQHEVRGLVAPFDISFVGELPGAVGFQGQTFAAATPTTASYKFNSYRVTYRYRFYSGESWKWQVGFTGKIRDARIALSQLGVSAEKTDLGFVPLLHLHGDWTWNEHWSLMLDIDALAAPQGRAEDILLALHWKPTRRWSYYAGYRMLEGGADNRDVFTFAWLHSLALGIQYAW
jgi:hypothetical protein